MTELAVVILNYNGRELLRTFLPSVLQHSGHAKIIVADNNSTDGSVTLIQKEFPQVDVIQIASNLGFCGGYNYALSKVQAKYYVLLNSDVEVTPGWTDPIISLFEKNATIGAVQPKILSCSDKTTFEYAGAGGGYIDALGYPFCRGRIFNTLEKDNHQYDDCLPVFWVTGACMFVRAELFHKMGGLDEDFFAHMEEIDLCWKLNRAKYSVFYQGASTVYHLGGGTLAANNPKKTYLNFRNGLSLIFKHYPFQQLLWKLPVRLCLDWIAAVQFLVTGSGASALAVCKAHLNFIGSLPKEIKKRKQLGREIPNFKVGKTFKGSIVFDYFLRGKRLFKELGQESF